MVDRPAEKPLKTKSRWGPRKTASQKNSDSSSTPKDKENEIVTELSKLDLNDRQSPPGTAIVPGSSLHVSSATKRTPRTPKFSYTLRTSLPVSEDMLSKLIDSCESKQTILATRYPESRNSWTFTTSYNNLVLSTNTKCSPKTIIDMRDIFGNFHKKGFFLWFTGEKGWILDPEQKSWAEYLDALNKLQDVFNLMAPDSLKKQMASSTKLLWKKEKHIQEAVYDIRQVLEVLWGLNDTNKQNFIMTKKGTRNCTPYDRWRRIMTEVRKLMRRSLTGPDAPIQWSAHPSCNRYGLTFITSDMMIEIIERLLVIMKNLFFGFEIEDHPHDALGTIWYNKKDGEFPAAFKTTSGALPDFQTAESFKKLLNRGELRNRTLSTNNATGVPLHEKKR